MASTAVDIDITQVHQLVDTAFLVPCDATGRSQVDLALAAQSRLESVVAAQRLVLARALAKVSPTPEADLAQGLRSGQRDAKGTMERARLADEVPQFGAALGEGAVTTTHLDKLKGSLGRLTPAQRTTLLADAEDLVGFAKVVTPEVFDQHLRARERAINADDGEALLAAQRRAVRLRDWIGDDGLHHFKLSLDPLTGLKVNNLIRAATEARFHGGDVPPDAPDLPQERHSFLRAHALLGLIDGTHGMRMGKPEVTVVVDTRVPHGAQPVVDWGLPIYLPRRVLNDLLGTARVNTVWVDGDSLVWAPGKLDLGCSSRLASLDQRRALRALYATCAIPGCTTRFDDCDIHHVVFWEHARRTDLAILVPVCSRHHQRIHDEGWQVHIDEKRTLTAQLPSGAILSGTPNRIEATRQAVPHVPERAASPP